jgi:hypothetical protein
MKTWDYDEPVHFVVKQLELLLGKPSGRRRQGPSGSGPRSIARSRDTAFASPLSESAMPGGNHWHSINSSNQPK